MEIQGKEEGRAVGKEENTITLLFPTKYLALQQNFIYIHTTNNLTNLDPFEQKACREVE